MLFLPSLGTVWRGAIIVIGLAAAVPIRAGDLRSHPAPARDYAAAVEIAQRIIASDDSVVARGGASILRVHGARTPRAVVLLHGFTDSPMQFAALAESLYVRGDNVFVPRLPHHAERGGDARTLGRLTAAELCHVGDAAADVAAGLGDTVVVLGLSAGANVAAWMAEQRREVRRAVIIAPAFEFTHVPSVLEKPVIDIGARVPNVSHRMAPDSTRPDRDPGFSTHGLAQVLRLGEVVRGDAGHATPMSSTVLFLVNAHDRTVKTAPALDFARSWNSRGAPGRVYEFPDSLGLPHNVVDPYERRANTGAVYPVLIALAQGTAVPSWVHAKDPR